MVHKVVTYCLGAASLCLVGLGLAWNSLFPPGIYWSPEKAREYRDAFRAVHGEQDTHDRDKAPYDEMTFKVALERYNKLQGELKSAQNSRGRTSTSLVVVGMALLAAALLAARRLPKQGDDGGG